MSDSSDDQNIILGAIGRRVATLRSEIRLCIVLSIIIFLFGASVVAVIFLYFRNDETELIKQFVGIGAGALTTGLGGALAKRALDLRSWIATGQDWQDNYIEAVGPPPDRLLVAIEEKILDWLEGK